MKVIGKNQNLIIEEVKKRTNQSFARSPDLHVAYINVESLVKKVASQIKGNASFGQKKYNVNRALDKLLNEDVLRYKFGNKDWVYLLDNEITDKATVRGWQRKDKSAPQRPAVRLSSDTSFKYQPSVSDWLIACESVAIFILIVALIAQ